MRTIDSVRLRLFDFSSWSASTGASFSPICGGRGWRWRTNVVCRRNSIPRAASSDEHATRRAVTEMWRSLSTVKLAMPGSAIANIWDCLRRRRIAFGAKAARCLGRTTMVGRQSRRRLHLRRVEADISDRLFMLADQRPRARFWQAQGIRGPIKTSRSPAARRRRLRLFRREPGRQDHAQASSSLSRYIVFGAFQWARVVSFNARRDYPVYCRRSAPAARPMHWLRYSRENNNEKISSRTHRAQ